MMISYTGQSPLMLMSVSINVNANKYYSSVHNNYTREHYWMYIVCQIHITHRSFWYNVCMSSSIIVPLMSMKISNTLADMYTKKRDISYQIQIASTILYNSDTKTLYRSAGWLPPVNIMLSRYSIWSVDYNLVRYTLQPYRLVITAQTSSFSSIQNPRELISIKV